MHVFKACCSFVQLLVENFPMLLAFVSDISYECDSLSNVHPCEMEPGRIDLHVYTNFLST